MRCDPISAGVKLQEAQRFKENRFYKSAMHAAVQYPDLAPLMWEEGCPAADDGLSSLPGGKQVVLPSNTCVRAQCACRNGCCCFFIMNMMKMNMMSECHDG